MPRQVVTPAKKAAKFVAKSQVLVAPFSTSAADLRVVRVKDGLLAMNSVRMTVRRTVKKGGELQYAGPSAQIYGKKVQKKMLDEPFVVIAAVFVPDEGEPLVLGTYTSNILRATGTMTGVSEPLVLGIETSCDETGVGIVRGHTLLADAVASSVEEHARFGGVVPEVASRAHLEAMVPTIERACETAGIRPGDVDAIAVTSGPGLAGALLVGVASAKALSIALGKPLYGVNHLAAHVAVDQLEHGPLPDPCLAMLVSGGHSSLLRVDDVTSDVHPLGATIDDAAGEAFDKVARLLGLPFPGGPHIDKAAASGSSVYVDFPRGLSSRRDLERHRFDFSFSGLKTAVARWVQAREDSGEPVPVADVAASFQEAVCDVLTRKAVDAAASEGIEDILIGGGVAANSRLRVLAEERAAARGIRVRVPRPGLCTDNGAMVAALGAEMVARGRAPSDLFLPADSSMPVELVSVVGSR